MQIGTQINATQKEIGGKKKVCNRPCQLSTAVRHAVTDTEAIPIGKGRCYRALKEESDVGKGEEGVGGVGRRERRIITEESQDNWQLCP